MGDQETNTTNNIIVTDDNNDVEQFIFARNIGDLAATGIDAFEPNTYVDVPPLGVAPYNIVTIGRINDILGAIERGINAPRLDRGRLAQIIRWSTELNAQINLLDTMMIYDT